MRLTVSPLAPVRADRRDVERDIEIAVLGADLVQGHGADEAKLIGEELAGSDGAGDLAGDFAGTR